MAIYSFPTQMGGDQQQGHYMLLNSYAKTTTAKTAVNALTGASAVTGIQDQFAFFIPGGQVGGQSMTWSHQHEYTDVKLARLITQSLGVIGDLMAGAATMLGTPINPQVDVLFRNTNLREYQFVLMMAPQSSDESTMMKNMLQQLRWNAASDLGPNSDGLFYQSPNEFDIRFYFMDANGVLKENTSIPKIARGVIKRIDIDYSPQGEWSTFYDGSPVSAMLTFTFLETKIIDKSYIKNGY